MADAQEAYDRREQELGAEIMRELERQVILAVLDRKWREHLYEMDYLREGIGLRGYGQRDPLVEYQREGYDMFNAMMEGIKEESVGSLFNLQVQVQENPIVEETAAGGSAAPAAVAEPAGLAVPAQGTPSRNGGAHARNGAGNGTGQGGPGQGGSNGRNGQRSQRGGRAQAGQGPRSAGAHARPEGDQPSPLPAGLAPRRAQQLQYSAPSLDGGARVETSQGPAVDDAFARAGRNDPCPCGSGRKFKRCHGDPRMRADL